jgi:hypothetical protein
MKLAHLILAHTRHNQLARLIKRLHHPDADIYIHVDEKTNSAEFDDLQLIAPIFFITNRVAVDWGNYNMVEATLNSFEEIISQNINYSHINLLSSQDYPLKNASQIQSFLFDNAGKTFMRSFAIPEEWDEPMGRLTKYNFGDYKFAGKHQLQNLANRILPDRKIPTGLKMYGRSQWFTITPQCALYVINYLRDNRSVRLFFKHTWACDELVFQTILLNSPLKDSVVNDHLRYIKFKRGDSRPKTLTIADAADLTASGKLYARKFDSAVDQQILDHLDSLAV